jgi:outer membrane receptor protein involved in Fe transport
MKNLLILCFFMQFKAVFATHGGSIHGFVASSTDNIEIQGASIYLTETGQKAYSNELGAFIFSDLEEKTYQIEVTFLGFEKQTATIDVKNHASSSIKILLYETPILLENIRISAKNSDLLLSLSTLDINARPIQSTQDILRSVPGLIIAQHAGGGKAEQIFLRGFDIDHGTDIALFVDDMPVNMVSHAHGQGYADLHFVIPELVEKVNFQKGTYVAKVGNFATAGFVKFETPDVLNENFLKLEAGDFGNLRLATAFNLLGQKAANKGNSAYISMETMLANGYFEANQDFKRFNIFGKYRLLLNENQTLSVSFSTFNSSWLASGQVPERAIKSGIITRFGAIDPNEGGQTGRSNLNLKHLYAYDEHTLIKNQIFFTNYDFELYSNFTFFLNDPINGDQIRQKEKRTLLGYNSSVQKTLNILEKEIIWNSGLQLRADQTQNSELSNTKNRTQTLKNIAIGDVQELNLGLFSEVSVPINDKLNVTTGLRYDYFNFSYHNKVDAIQQPFGQKAKGILNPKINLNYQISSKLQMFLQSGGGFHSNDTRVIAADVGISASNKPILPRAIGTEIGANIKPLPHLLLTTSLWQLHLEQEFVYVGDAGVVEPGGRTLRRGIDLSARWQATDWLFFDFDANYTNPLNIDAPEGANFIPLAPVRTSIGGFQIEKGALKGNLRYRYVGDRAANEDYSLTAEGYFLLDAMLAWSPKYKGKSPLTFTLTAQNLMNSNWKEAQFETETRLFEEQNAVTEIHFTPGVPFFMKFSANMKF